MKGTMPSRLEVIVGPMFSGKTERLIAKLYRAQYARKRIRILKPRKDTRTEAFIASRAVDEGGTTRVTATLDAVLIGSREEFLEAIADGAFDVLAIDEAQFFPLDGSSPNDPLGWFGREIRELLRARSDSPVRVIVAGLDMDFAENPFSIMPGLMALADSVEKLSAVCMSCGADEAHLSQRLSPNEEQVAIGDADTYQVRCRACYAPPSTA
ncbi:MAG: thymidine kinase [Candidatus Parcubacteria bacterium]|jgi:thymidine kinase|nr:thymidine kinase [Candidatus Parcubacteria bacterium]